MESLNRKTVGGKRFRLAQSISVPILAVLAAKAVLRFEAVAEQLWRLSRAILIPTVVFS